MPFKRVLLVIVALVPIGILASVGWHRLRCSDRSEAYYPTYDLAKEAIEHGWIPSRVPSVALEIHEEHDIDTNEVWIRFRLPGSDRSTLVTDMRRLSQGEVRLLHARCPCAAGWWYVGIIEQEPADDGALNADIYIGKDQTSGRLEFVALDRTEPFVYYWNDPSGSSGISRD